MATHGFLFTAHGPHPSPLPEGPRGRGSEDRATNTNQTVTNQTVATGIFPIFAAHSFGPVL